MSQSKLFHYPKARHVRRFNPGPFRRYGSYKRWLQQEFGRVCVYCREPDSLSRNLNFGVDHYRPQSRFGHLTCVYANLYYCCGGCNSRKNDDWPVDESKGPYVVNPCEMVMADHLRFEAATGNIESRTPHGLHTIELLQLNERLTVEQRLRQRRLLEV